MTVRKILILAANPKNTERLRLDQEVREIQEGLRLSKGRDGFQVIDCWAVRTEDLRRAVLEHEPQIVHFSGHGAGEKGLILEGTDGNAKGVSAKSLGGLFELCPTVECVLLNACYSVDQAKAIAPHVNVVVGMKQAIGDKAALAFAQGFYDGLGYGRDYADAFKFGCNAIDLENLPEELTPVLTLKEDHIGRQEAGVKGKGQGERGADVEMSDAENVSDNESPSPLPSTAGAFPLTPNPSSQSQVQSKRIVISYKRDITPDETVALALYEALGQSHQVFIDQAMPPGTAWADRIQSEVRQADALVVLLSEQSAQSEMVLGEVTLAHELAKTTGKPAILPVRLNYRTAFEYPLKVYLDPINWAMWEGETPRLIADLNQALVGGDLPVATPEQKAQLLEASQAAGIPRPSVMAQPIRNRGKGEGGRGKVADVSEVERLELPEGTMGSESGFYIERDADELALGAIERQGVTVTIKGPRQMGKSSLLIRTVEAAQAQGKEIAFLDFQLFERSVLQDADAFYQQFCLWLTDELDLEDCVDEYWQRPLGNPQRCTRYMGRHILKSLEQPLVLAMDEVERMFDTTFRDDFFSMLRSWHNQRATKKLWKQLDLVLVTSTEPYQLIADLNQSPFNVGQVLDLQDFDQAQVADLNERHGAPFAPSQLRQLMMLLNGHPYLTRQALYLVASERWSPRDLFAQATEDQGPFGAHLRNHLFRLSGQEELVAGMVKILKQEVCADEAIYFRLHGAGLVNREGQRVFPRCQLYADYFWEHLA